MSKKPKASARRDIRTRTIKMNIVIDPEFKELIPPLTDDEFKQLEANLLRDGCKEPLTVWMAP